MVTSWKRDVALCGSRCLLYMLASHGRYQNPLILLCLLFLILEAGHDFMLAAQGHKDIVSSLLTAAGQSSWILTVAQS